MYTELTGPPPAYKEVPPQIQEGYRYDQEYPPNYAPAESGFQSSTSCVVVSLPTQNMVCLGNPRTQDYTYLAIFSCLFCAWPLGLVAIILAMQARSLADTGHNNDAKRRSNVALGFIIASVILGIICIVAIIVVNPLKLWNMS